MDPQGEEKMKYYTTLDDVISDQAIDSALVAAGVAEEDLREESLAIAHEVTEYDEKKGVFKLLPEFEPDTDCSSAWLNVFMKVEGLAREE